MSKLRLRVSLLCALAFGACAGAVTAHGLAEMQTRTAARKTARRAARGPSKACRAAPPPTMNTDRFEDLLARAKENGSVQLVVRLCVPFRPEGELSDRDARRQRAAIARAQDALLKELRGARVSNVKRYEYTPFVALTADAQALRRLRASRTVADVTEDTAVPAAGL